MLAEYVLTSIIVILLPGTGVLYTIAYGLSGGWRAGAMASLGCTLGILPHIVASIAGLAAVLHASAVAFQAFKYLGVAYLFYMAWSVLRDREILQLCEGNASNSLVRIVTNGFLLNILNPKLSIFFMAFLPHFIPAGTVNPGSYMLMLAIIFMFLTFIVFVAYGTFASFTRHYVVSKPHVVSVLRYGFAGAFCILGLQLAYSRQ